MRSRRGSGVPQTRHGNPDLTTRPPSLLKRALFHRQSSRSVTFVSQGVTIAYWHDLPNGWTVEVGNGDCAMTAVEQLAQFAVSAPYEEISETARLQMKIRILDALGCAIGALAAAPPQIIRKNIAEFDSDGKCTLL